MPIKFQLNFKIRAEEGSFRRPANLKIYPDQLHGFFMNLLPERLRTEFHKPSPVKPFSLWCEGIFRVEEIIEREVISIEISLLKDEYFAPLVYHLSLLEGDLSFGELRVTLSDFKGGLLRRDRYFDYSPPDNSLSSDYLTFNFVTPTSFRRGDHDYPLPDPNYIYKSLLRKWNQYSPLKLSETEILCELKRVYIAYANFTTQTVYLHIGGAVTCFTGRLMLGRGKISNELWSWLVHLGKFGEFSGIGKKTTMGFGKVLVKTLATTDLKDQGRALE